MLRNVENGRDLLGARPSVRDISAEVIHRSNKNLKIDDQRR